MATADWTRVIPGRYAAREMRIAFRNVSKSFGSRASRQHAVVASSWEAGGGEVFGLLGPNGAGKTTMIRMLLDIFRADEGDILVGDSRDGNRSPEFKRRVGYLPEERGLYRKRKVMDVLIYLAALKGQPRADARHRAQVLLERFGLSAYGGKKVATLSKGMAQKLQIVSCILHDPDLVVLDEPFSGLDPVNTRLIRELVLELKRAGKLVILSTHMMGEVEALCDRILLIHRGRQVLYGELHAIRKSHTDYQVVVDPAAAPEGLACVEKVVTMPDEKRVYLRSGKQVTDLMLEMGRSVRPSLSATHDHVVVAGRQVIPREARPIVQEIDLDVVNVAREYLRSLGQELFPVGAGSLVCGAQKFDDRDHTPIQSVADDDVGQALLVHERNAHAHRRLEQRRGLGVDPLPGLRDVRTPQEATRSLWSVVDIYVFVDRDDVVWINLRDDQVGHQRNEALVKIVAHMLLLEVRVHSGEWRRIAGLLIDASVVIV